MKAYFITALTSERVNRAMEKEHGYRFYAHKKCFGFASSKAEALRWIRKYGSNFVECLFDLLVVELYESGLERIPAEIAWFRWSDKKRQWLLIAKPRDQRGTVCYAMP